MDEHTASRPQIESVRLPGRSAVICMADTRDQLATIKDTDNVFARLDLVFNDATTEFLQVRPPTFEDALAIIEFVNANRDVPFLVIQCEAGIGRSRAVLAALRKISGREYKSILREGTYNRRLYRLLLDAAGVAADPEPLVSMNVRVKYAPDRLRMFVLSMQRQRYENWELVAVTDGPNPAASRLINEIQEPRVRLIETEKPLGYWGHPYRQLGLDACRGEFIGMSNDDNYYVPGYFEQMLHALEDADLAACPILHSYKAWQPVLPGGDLGGWIARASLVKRARWPGNYFEADADYFNSLVALANGRTVEVDRLLFVHN